MDRPDLDELSRSATDALHVGVGLLVLALQHTTDQRRAIAVHLGTARTAVEGTLGEAAQVVPPEARDVLLQLRDQILTTVAQRVGTR